MTSGELRRLRSDSERDECSFCSEKDGTQCSDDVPLLGEVD